MSNLSRRMIFGAAALIGLPALRPQAAALTPQSTIDASLPRNFAVYDNHLIDLDDHHYEHDDLMLVGHYHGGISVERIDARGSLGPVPDAPFAFVRCKMDSLPYYASEGWSQVQVLGRVIGKRNAIS